MYEILMETIEGSIAPPGYKVYRATWMCRVQGLSSAVSILQGTLIQVSVPISAPTRFINYMR